jgi:hypothetical protein
MVFTLVGYDTFEGEEYTLDGVYHTEQEAVVAAQIRLRHLEQTQPSSSSGGQGMFGIQDRVYVLRPDAWKNPTV